MKSLLILIPALLLPIPCFAQRPTPRASAAPRTASPAIVKGVTPAGVGGFGNIVHPGTGGSATAYNNRTVRRSGAYPLYVGGAYVPSYYSGYSSSYAPDYSALSQLNPQQQYSQSPVVINQYFAPPLPPDPVTTFYQPSAGQPQAGDDAPPAQTKYYLLAFKDHSVYSALAYWVEDKTLHYVTTQNTHNQASLDLVDVDFTKQLNQDREAPFSIETPSK